MTSCLTRHHILNDILPVLFFIKFPFVDNVCTLNYSSCESAIWVGDGKIWSENKAFRADSAPVEVDLLLGPDSSSEMDSEIDDQSYSPTEVYALTWHGYTAHIMHMVSCIA